MATRDMRKLKKFPSKLLNYVLPLAYNSDGGLMIVVDPNKKARMSAGDTHPGKGKAEKEPRPCLAY